MSNKKQSIKLYTDKEFVPYEEALELKELGFNDTCFSFYRKGKLDESEAYYKFGVNVFPPYEIVAPIFSQAFEFLRDKYDLHHIIQLIHHTIKRNKKYIGIAYSSVVNFTIAEFDNYEEAELACLKRLIKIVKERNNE